MKTIGLIGGMSWESSAEYYRIINQEAARRLGGLHSARSLMYSVDFAEVEALQHQGRWSEATALMVDAAQRLERGGADLVLLCTNTMHKMADAVQESIAVPLLHIADATGERVREKGLTTVGLLGTRFTMEQDFYRGRLIDRYGLDVLIPEPESQRQMIHDVIYDELCRGEVRDTSRAAYKDAIEGLVARGAQGVILGCTEIMLLITQEDSPVPVFDTTTIHAHAAVAAAVTLADAEKGEPSHLDMRGGSSVRSDASLQGRCFHPMTNTVGGEVGTQTVFEFSQDGDLVYARYAGGQVRLGYLVGIRTGTDVSFRYTQVNRAGETATGQSHDRIEILPDGRLRLHETWSWDSKEGSGTSKLEEIGGA